MSRLPNIFDDDMPEQTPKQLVVSFAMHLEGTPRQRLASLREYHKGLVEAVETSTKLMRSFELQIEAIGGLDLDPSLQAPAILDADKLVRYVAGDPRPSVRKAVLAVMSLGSEPPAPKEITRQLQAAGYDFRKLNPGDAVRTALWNARKVELLTVDKQGRYSFKESSSRERFMREEGLM